MGCIGFAATYMGMNYLAAMGLNTLACDTLRANGVQHVLQGDVQNPQDRYRLHVTPQITRSMIAAGFPCQPLSTQGDGKGINYPRSGAFFGTTKMVWEQDSYGLLLECVPGAMHASFVQEELQKLAWSMGKSLYEQLLHLDQAWQTLPLVGIDCSQGV